MVRLFQAGLIAIGARFLAATMTVLAAVRHRINPPTSPCRSRKSRLNTSEYAEPTVRSSRFGHLASAPSTTGTPGIRPRPAPSALRSGDALPRDKAAAD